MNRFVERYLCKETPQSLLEDSQLSKVLPRQPSKPLTQKYLQCHRLSTGAVISLVEAVYRDAFYEALEGVLGFATRVPSEWSPSGKGRIDFHLLDVPWGFEFLREMDRLLGHCERLLTVDRIRVGLKKDGLRIG